MVLRNGGKKTRRKNKGSASPRSSGVTIPTQNVVAGPSEIVAGLSVAESDLLLYAAGWQKRKADDGDLDCGMLKIK